MLLLIRGLRKAFQSSNIRKDVADVDRTCDGKYVMMEVEFDLKRNQLVQVSVLKSANVNVIRVFLPLLMLTPLLEVFKRTAVERSFALGSSQTKLHKRSRKEGGCGFYVGEKRAVPQFHKRAERRRRSKTS